jgi:hypothetical protein
MESIRMSYEIKVWTRPFLVNPLRSDSERSLSLLLELPITQEVLVQIMSLARVLASESIDNPYYSKYYDF